VVHRDVCPDNLMVVADGKGGETVKVIDFGIARTTLPGAGAALTTVGTFVGRLEYCSPEQAGKLEPGESIDGRADVYSLGVVLYQALTGRLPFSAPTPIGYLTRHISTPPPPPATLGIALPRAVETLLLAMLAKDRARRPQSMAEVAERLEAAAAAAATPAPAAVRAKAGPVRPAPDGATPARPGEPTSVRRPERPRLAEVLPAGRRFVAQLGLVLLGVVIAVAAAAIWLQVRDRGPAGGWLAAAGSRLGFGQAPGPTPGQAGPPPSSPTPAPSLAPVPPPVTETEPAAAPPAAATPCGDGMELVPGGEFAMGSADGDGAADERPRHTVGLAAFCIDRHEVTNAAYERHDPGHRAARDPVADRDLCPVVRVSWDEAAAYCAALGKRLPTEAEWERAARGGLDGRRYPWGDEPVSGGRANYCDASCEHDWRDGDSSDGHRHAAPVGTYPANGFGLADMAGNVWEWVADWYDAGAYRPGRSDHPTGPATGTMRVCRGGSFSNEPGDLRVAVRSASPPGSRLAGVGFRCASAPR
jgi:formylglycine-generating enzyme required for sulfatase activity